MSYVCSLHDTVYKGLGTTASLYLCEKNMDGIRNVLLVRQPKCPINHLHAFFHNLAIHLL